jgi:hypothetical protein
MESKVELSIRPRRGDGVFSARLVGVTVLLLVFLCMGIALPLLMNTVELMSMFIDIHIFLASLPLWSRAALYGLALLFLLLVLDVFRRVLVWIIHPGIRKFKRRL